MKNKLLLIITGLAITILLIPSILVTAKQGLFASQNMTEKSSKNGNDIFIRVYMSKEKRVVEYPLETYIAGVVASEMPANFHIEALKAQAFAARTYIVNRIYNKKYEDLRQWGKAAQMAHVTDTEKHQVFTPEFILKKQWGSIFKERFKFIQQAVEETKGQIITFKGQPIYAAFFSTSNGKTENSEDYFAHKFAYLRSVHSKWDLQTPKFYREKSLTSQTMIDQLEQKTGKKIALTTSTNSNLMKIIKMTTGGRVSQIKIGDQTFTGREVREAMGLASTDFSYKIANGKITFTTEGYGHGVGMSQWGANYMGRMGKSASEIIAHYYMGTKITFLKDLGIL